MPPWKQALRNLPIGLALALTVAPGEWLWVLVPAARALGPNALDPGVCSTSLDQSGSGPWEANGQVF